MLKEFKEFAMKGNLVDMAVGFVMGGAFATVVTAFIVVQYPFLYYSPSAVSFFLYEYLYTLTDSGAIRCFYGF